MASGSEIQGLFWCISVASEYTHSLPTTSLFGARFICFELHSYRAPVCGALSQPLQTQQGTRNPTCLVYSREVRQQLWVWVIAGKQMFRAFCALLQKPQVKTTYVVLNPLVISQPLIGSSRQLIVHSSVEMLYSFYFQRPHSLVFFLFSSSFSVYFVGSSSQPSLLMLRSPRTQFLFSISTWVFK